MTTLTIDDVVGHYVKLRDAVQRIEGEHTAQLAPYKEKMEKIEAWLMAKSQETGVDSFKTPHGTAYKQLQQRTSIENWDVLLPFLIEHDLTHLLTKSVAKTQVLDYMKQTGALPPGVSLEQFYVININRPRKERKDK